MTVSLVEKLFKVFLINAWSICNLDMCDGLFTIWTWSVKISKCFFSHLWKIIVGISANKYYINWENVCISEDSFLLTNIRVNTLLAKTYFLKLKIDTPLILNLSKPTTLFPLSYQNWHWKNSMFWLFGKQNERDWRLFL